MKKRKQKLKRFFAAAALCALIAASAAPDAVYAAYSFECEKTLYFNIDSYSPLIYVYAAEEDTIAADSEGEFDTEITWDENGTALIALANSDDSAALPSQDKEVSFVLYTTDEAQLYITYGNITYAAQAESITSGSRLEKTLGEGYIYRFYNSAGQELTFMLKGGEFSYVTFSLTVSADDADEEDGAASEDEDGEYDPFGGAGYALFGVISGQSIRESCSTGYFKGVSADIEEEEETEEELSAETSAQSTAAASLAAASSASEDEEETEESKVYLYGTENGEIKTTSQGAYSSAADWSGSSISLVICNAASEDDYAEEDVQAAVSFFAGESLTVTLVTSSKTYTAQKSAVEEGDLLYSRYGEGYIYRFYDSDGAEITFALSGGEVSYEAFSLCVSGAQENFRYYIIPSSGADADLSTATGCLTGTFYVR